MSEADKLLIWLLGNIDRRISALEMDSEGAGDQTIRQEIDELEGLLKTANEEQKAEPSTPEAT